MQRVAINFSGRSKHEPPFATILRVQIRQSIKHQLCSMLVDIPTVRFVLETPEHARDSGKMDDTYDIRREDFGEQGGIANVTDVNFEKRGFRGGQGR